MSDKNTGAVSLPDQPKDKEFEEYVAAHFQCAGFFVERNIIERDVKEVLELDIITTRYDGGGPPDIRLLEIKSGSWGFPEVFKIFGWLKYLEISKGALVVRDKKETPDAHAFYMDKAKSLQIDLLVADPKSSSLDSALGPLLGGKSTQETDISSWRFSYWLERNLIKRLIAKKKSTPGVKRFLAMDDYLFAVNSGVFFTSGAVNRAKHLYQAFQKHPKLSAKCAHEELGHNFDDDVHVVEKSLFQRTFYQCECTDIQTSTYIEHRARLVILKNAIDHLIYSQAGQADKAGEKTRRMLGFDFANAPATFLEALGKIGTHKYFHRYPAFWQSFLWLFGGFILQDYQQKEYEALSERTGIPVDEIPRAFEAYGELFPRAGGWFINPPHSNIRCLHMFPVPFMGIGANLRKSLYVGSDAKFDQLQLTGRFTLSDLKKWNNLVVEVLNW